MSVINSHLSSALGIVQGAKSKIISIVIDKTGNGIGGFRDRVGDIKDNIGSRVEDIKDTIQNNVNPIIDDILDNPLNDTSGSLEDKLSESRLQDVKDIFGDSIRYDEVIVNDSSLMADVNSNFNSSSRPFVLGNVINSEGKLDDRTFIHEMMHIHQYNKLGWEYLPPAAYDAFVGNYDYEHNELQRVTNDSTFEGNRLEQFGLEQQAEIVADYYMIKTRFLPGETVTLPNGLVVNDGNIATVLQTYEPYIQEIQDTEPRDSWRKEIDETGEEVIREAGEGGEEILEEIKAGDISGTVYETGEAAVEITREVAEGAIETGIEGAKKIPGKIEDGIDSVTPWDGFIPG